MTITGQTRILLRIGRSRKNMPFKDSFLRVHFPKISLLCTKVREGLFRSLFVEANFLSSAIYSLEFSVRHRRAILRNKRQNFCGIFLFLFLFCRADIPSLKFLLIFAARYSFLSLFYSFENYSMHCHVNLVIWHSMFTDFYCCFYA